MLFSFRRFLKIIQLNRLVTSYKPTSITSSRSLLENSRINSRIELFCGYSSANMEVPKDKEEDPKKFVSRRVQRKNNLNELNQMTREQLIERVLKVDSYNLQLKATINKKFTEKLLNGSEPENKKQFDFSKHHKRHILLKICYMGWDYAGFAVQDGGLETIELHLFNGLTKVCLIESRETSNYNRCGRTDKGVSAFSQIISIDIRSRIEPKNQCTVEGVAEELDYVDLLNKVLPRQIRAICWMPLVTSTFSARFDCQGRGYKYFFPRGNLDVELMRTASQDFVGCYDFRNFCKMDVSHGVLNYMRRINHVEINLVQKNELDEMDMFCIDINGSAFLWHMIRSMMTILFVIGEKKEAPSIIKDLLDIEKYPNKPQYFLAHEIPLNLFFTKYREDVLGEDDLPINTEMANKWHFNNESFRKVIINLQEEWCIENVKSTMIYEMLKSLQQDYREHFPDEAPIIRQSHTLSIDNKKVNYTNIEYRAVASSLDERLAHINKKRKIHEAVRKEECDNNE